MGREKTSGPKAQLWKSTKIPKTKDLKAEVGNPSSPSLSDW